MNIHPDVVKAYKKTQAADDRHAQHGTTATKRNVTRAANNLSKMIKQHHGDLGMSDNIKLRTKLQNMSESTDWVCGQCNSDPCVCETEINEEMMTAGDAGIPHDTKNMGPRGVIRNILRRKIGTPINVTDRRRKKNKSPRMLKKYRKYTDG